MALVRQASATLLLLGTAWAAKTAVPLFRKNAHLDPQTARSDRNVVYYGTFNLGTPGKEFTGCFDTGSSDTWVPSTMCLDPSCMSHDRFNQAASSTFQASASNAPKGTERSMSTRGGLRGLGALLAGSSGDTSRGLFQVTYGTGQVMGTVGSDTLTLGADPPISVASQGFGLVFASSVDFLGVSCDGLFGLGFPSISNLQTVPVFFNMVTEKLLDKDQFAIYFNPNPLAEPAGELMFGGSNPALYTGELVEIPIVKKGYWQVNFNGLKVAGGDPIATTASDTILDSGTSAIMLSQADHAALHKAIPGLTQSDSGFFVVTGGCAAVPKLPAVSFNLGTPDAPLWFSVPAKIWTRPLEGETTANQTTGDCISNIFASSGSHSILGAPFLRAWYTIYNYDYAQKTASVQLVQAAGLAAAPATPALP